MDRPYETHAFVCTFGPWCRKDGGAEVHARMKALVKELGLASRVRANKSGCLNQCGHGPMAVVYPEGVWYARLDVEGAERVVREHLGGGAPVEAYRYRPAKPGGNKTAEVLEAEAKEKDTG